LLCFDERYDAFVVTKTWHECSGSTTLKRATPPGYRCIDAARPIVSDAAVDTVDYQNHGGLAIIYRDAVKLRKKSLDVDVSTFEFLLGHASTNVGRFVLLAVYRPGSRAPSELFFDELSAVFEQLMTYGCPVVVCGDFNIHVDDKRDTLGEVYRDETGCHSADDTASFFKDKVNGVRKSTASTPVYDVPYRATATLEDWTAVTAEGIQKLISSHIIIIWWHARRA